MAQRLAQHLIARGLLPARTVDEAMRAMESLGGGLDTVLLEAGGVTEAVMLQAMSDTSGVRPVNLADFEPNVEAAALLPPKLARQLRLAPLSRDGNTVHVASAYPIARAQLKDLGFLLGKKLELWVALECRVKDWQAALYGGTLEPRVARLLAALDPSRQTGSGLSPADETLSPDVLERIAQGIVEEPVLLSHPKRGAVTAPAPEPPPEDAPTRVLDLEGYGKFARRVSGVVTSPALPALAATPPRITFPGGVAPPRAVSRDAAPGPPRREHQLADPAPEPRDLALGLDPDLDFSTVNEALQPRRVPTPDNATSRPMPPRFEELRALAASPPVPLPARAPRSKAPPAPVMEAPAVLRTAATWADQVPPAPTPGQGSLPEWLTRTPEPRAPDAAATPPAPGGEEVVLPAPPGLSDSSAAGWSLAQARASLREAVQDRERLVSVALDYARRTFEFVAAFAVVKGTATGWAARGEPSAVARVREAAIPLDAASVFRTVALTRESYVGPMPLDPLSRRYLAQLERAPRTVFLWPIEVQSRLVALVYGDCGPRPVSQRRLADFILFCRELPAAFHELIAFRKQHLRFSAVVPAPPVLAPSAAMPPPSPTPATQGDWFDGLIALLTGPDPADRSTAMAELLRTPDASARAISHAFPGPSGWSRLPVVELPDPDELGPLPGALARLGAEGARALAPLLDAHDSDTRYLALLTAGSLRFPDVVGGILRGLFDLEPDISSAARAAASAMKDLPSFQHRLPELRKELFASDPLRRSLAARALGGLHDRASVEGLINLTSSEDELCAQSAADALKELTRFNHGANPTAWTQWWARAREYRRVDWLVAALESGDFDLRLAAIEELSVAVGEHFGYFADSPEPERAEAVARWRDAVAARPQLEI